MDKRKKATNILAYAKMKEVQKMLTKAKENCINSKWAEVEESDISYSTHKINEDIK